MARGGYDAGAVKPHLQVARQPLDKLHLGAVNLDGPAALGVLLAVTPNKEEGKTGSPAARQQPPAKRQRLDAGGGAGYSARSAALPRTRRAALTDTMPAGPCAGPPRASPLTQLGLIGACTACAGRSDHGASGSSTATGVASQMAAREEATAYFMGRAAPGREAGAAADPG